MEINKTNSLKGRTCSHCNKPLKLIGLQRKNGNNDFVDYKARHVHKKCYHEYMAKSNVLKMISDIEKKITDHNKPLVGLSVSLE